MIVVSDTSPINYLTLIGHEALLQSLFGEIIITASVFDELSHPGAPVQIQHLLSARPAWLRIVEPTPDLGSGSAIWTAASGCHPAWDRDASGLRAHGRGERRRRPKRWD